MFVQLCALFVLLGSIQAYTYEDANRYMDKVLNGPFVQEASYSRLDPYKLENISVSLNRSGSQMGKAVLHNGQIIHMSKVRLSADCTKPFLQSANITFTCFLGFDKLQVNYTANVTYQNIEAKFYPKVHIQGTNVTIQVTTNREDDIPNLKLIFINRVGNMTVTTEMINIANLASIIGPPIREALERKTIQTIHRAVGSRFKDALGYSIYKTPVGFW